MTDRPLFVRRFMFEGVAITEPYMDETGREVVDPEEYYGEAYLAACEPEPEWINPNVAACIRSIHKLLKEQELDTPELEHLLLVATGVKY